MPVMLASGMPHIVLSALVCKYHLNSLIFQTGLYDRTLTRSLSLAWSFAASTTTCGCMCSPSGVDTDSELSSSPLTTMAPTPIASSEFPLPTLTPGMLTTTRLVIFDAAESLATLTAATLPALPMRRAQHKRWPSLYKGGCRGVRGRDRSGHARSVVFEG